MPQRWKFNILIVLIGIILICGSKWESSFVKGVGRSVGPGVKANVLKKRAKKYHLISKTINTYPNFGAIILRANQSSPTVLLPHIKLPHRVISSSTFINKKKLNRIWATALFVGSFNYFFSRFVKNCPFWMQLGRI